MLREWPNRAGLVVGDAALVHQEQPQQQQTMERIISPTLLEGLDDAHKRLYDELVNDLGQAHLFASFAEGDAHEEDDAASSSSRLSSLKALLQQLHDLDQGYTDGGLKGYIKNARTLLEDSRLGINPLAGWIPSVPDGQTLEVGSDAFHQMEALGMPEIGATGFVLVAGGLGERLGYSDIKVLLCALCLLLVMSRARMVCRYMCVVSSSVYLLACVFASIASVLSRLGCPPKCPPELPTCSTTSSTYWRSRAGTLPNVASCRCAS
jgi:hypothetical protein